MSASKQDIRRWLKEAKGKKNCTHLIVALDTFDYENYPVFVFKRDNISECVETIQGEDMQSVNEVYNMSMNIEEQLSAAHVWNT